MTGQRRRTGLAGVGLTVLVLAAGTLAACAADPTDGGGAGAPAASPLAEILGWGMMDEGRAGGRQISEVERERHDLVEQLTAACMAGRGFDYVPVPLEELTTGPFDEAYALPADEFAAEYGYGVTTLASPSTDPAPDPNHRIHDSLPDPEQEAYRRALWGEGVADGDDSSAGCQMLATQQVYGTDGGDAAELHKRFKELFDQLNTLWERIEQDPRLRNVNPDWVACMSEAGYPGFNRPHEARQSVFDAMAALRAAGEPDPQDVAKLREYELALAPVDHHCRAVHIEGPRREVAYELEAEFVAEHRAELEAYRDWVSGAGSGPGGSG